jgi:integrase
MSLRPDEVFRMRWEHIHSEKRLCFNPYGKSRKARRWIPISQRVIDVLRARVSNQSALGVAQRGKPSARTVPGEWVFPSGRAEYGHLTTVAQAVPRCETAGRTTRVTKARLCATRFCDLRG